VRGASDLKLGAVAQLGERRLCKPQVVGSIPIGSTTCRGSPVASCGAVMCGAGKGAGGAAMDSGRRG
jgi:hypothetical protein